MSQQVIKVLVVDDNDKVRDDLIEQLRYDDVEVVGESTFGAAAYTWAQQLAVDVVVISIEEPVARALRTIESLTVGGRTWPVVGLSSQGDREMMRKAMMAGARDFLARPVSSSELHDTIVTIHRVEQNRRRATEQGDDPSQRLGTIVTVAGFKGGIGKSTMATNIAVSLAQQTQQHVALIDLDLQFGDTAVMLDVVPSHTIEHAVHELDRLDPQLIQGMVANHASRVKLLAAPATPEASDEITGAHVGRILEMLASTNDFVIVDTPPHLDEISATAMDLSTLVILVVAPEVPCIRRTKAALTLMQSWGYSRDKVKLIVNRSHRKAEVTIAEIEEVLQYPVYTEIPDDRAAIKAISLGTPVAMSAPRSKSGRAINELGRDLAGIAHRERKFALFRRHVQSRGPASDRLLPPAPPSAQRPAVGVTPAPLANGHAFPPAAGGPMLAPPTAGNPFDADWDGIWQPRAGDASWLTSHSAYGYEYPNGGAAPLPPRNPYGDAPPTFDQPKSGD